ncbi:MAG TPA: hypothetical protein ENG50_01690 [Candidatus Altiarchaeales archaeon]|nr:hypothetical protein [Candidatus Altiarchaeales archaeon]
MVKNLEESNYDFEIEKILKEIKEKKAKRVGLQFPEGLKQYAVEIAEIIERETGAVAFIFFEASYGACDLKEEICKKIDLDLLIHFGHAPYRYSQ